MLLPPTLRGSPSATGSPVLASLAMRSAVPAGATTERSGVVPAHANLSPRQARDLGLLTSGTFGPTGIGSSASAALTELLASRLRHQTASCGSTLWQLIWKREATPSGRLIFRLRASAPQISETDCGGPRAGWATPATRDYRTPNHKPLADRGGGAKGEQLNNQVAHAIPGASLSGLPAEAETGRSGGLLNPKFSAWLMAIPPEWDEAAPSRLPRAKPGTWGN